MLYKVFAVYDTGVSVWFPPLYMRSIGEAMRWWIDACNDPQCKFSKHPADYILFDLGSFDDSNCKFDLFEAPVRLSVAIECKRSDLVEGGGLGAQAPQ